MRPTVNRQLCRGHGQCALSAPEVYKLDEVGECMEFEHDVPKELEGAALSGMRACPESAIEIVVPFQT